MGRLCTDIMSDFVCVEIHLEAGQKGSIYCLVHKIPVNCSNLSPCSFLKSFSDMATGKSSSPTGGWILTLKQSSLVLKKKKIKAD
jgi:hypothetical protein